MTVKRSLLVLLIAVITLPLLTRGVQVIGQSADQQATTETPPALVQEVATAVPTAATNDTSTTSTISALGSVEAKSVTELYFQTSGTVNGVYVDVGDTVNAGDVIADLDATDAWTTYQKAQLSLQSAELSLTALEEPATADEIAVAKANITSAQAAYSSIANGSSDTVTQLQLKVQQAQDQLTALQTARANMNGSEDEITLEEAKIGAQTFNLEIAQLQLQAAQTPASSSLWSASIKIQQAENSLAQLEAGPSDSDIQSAQLKIKTAQQAVTDAQNAVLKTQLIAPVSGYVTAINVAAGDSASSASAAIEISDTSAYQMTVPVNELDVKKIAVGDSAVIDLDALSGVTIQGTVTNIGWISSTSSDGIVTYDVTVQLNTDDSRVRLGMTGQVEIESESAV